MNAQTNKKEQETPRLSHRHKIAVNPLAFAEMCYWLTNGAYTTERLVELCGASKSTVERWLRYLRRPNRKVVYISGHLPTEGRPRNLYSWGQLEDKKFPAQTGAEHSRKYRDRKRREQLRVIQHRII